MEIKPTIREVKVILNSMGVELPTSWYNDIRVIGGRIKASGLELKQPQMRRLENTLSILFPRLTFSVYIHLHARCGNWVSTCIKWKTAE